MEKEWEVVGERIYYPGVDRGVMYVEPEAVSVVPLCEDGWRYEPTACGDPEHCSPVYSCICNPEFDDDHECTNACVHV